MGDQDPRAESVRRVIERSQKGDAPTSDDLVPLVYDELRRLAQARMAQLGPGQTMQATALVHEAWVRMVGNGDPGWDGRAHFFGVAARAMREILIEKARARGSLKRGGGWGRLTADALTMITSHGPADDLIDFEEALVRLELEHGRKADVVTLRFFAGLSMAEIALELGVSVPTVERDWRYARAWLRRELHAEEGGGP